MLGLWGALGAVRSANGPRAQRLGGSAVLPGPMSHLGHPPFSLLCPQLALGSLFQGLELGSLQPTSLTLMYPLGAALNSTSIHLDPMEIATFRIRLV